MPALIPQLGLQPNIVYNDYAATRLIPVAAFSLAIIEFLELFCVLRVKMTSDTLLVLSRNMRKKSLQTPAE